MGCAVGGAVGEASDLAVIVGLQGSEARVELAHRLERRAALGGQVCKLLGDVGGDGGVLAEEPAVGFPQAAAQVTPFRGRVGG